MAGTDACKTEVRSLDADVMDRLSDLRDDDPERAALAADLIAQLCSVIDRPTRRERRRRARERLADIRTEQ